MRPRCLRSVILAAAASALLPAPAAMAQHAGGADARSGSAERGAGRVEFQPYIEAAQVLTAELDPGNDVFTYSRVAAGIDAGISGRNSAAAASIRYERRIGYGDTRDSDTISGIARGSLAVVPGNVTFETGAMAARTRVDGTGGTSIATFEDVDSTSQVYSLYAGPSVRAMAGDVAVQGSYLVGYTRVESPDAFIPAIGAEAVDIFDDSVTQNAALRLSTAPHTVLPVGLGVEGGWSEQEISNLDQRVRNRYLREDVTLQVSPTLAFVGGVGYEDVEVSSRDAVRDANGDPVLDSNFRYVTDKNGPRIIAYDTDGLIWDVGVLWRPSRRTSLAATVGRRYGSTTYYGNLSYAPDSRSNLSINAYDNVTGFGGLLVNNLAGLPTEFTGLRNSISGDLFGCVDSTEGNNCALAGIGAMRSAVFRGRGVNASYSRSLGRTSMGVAAGYDRRKFIGAAGTVLEAANGVVDENVWAAIYARRQLDARSDLAANAYVSWFDNGFDLDGTAMGYSASLAYYRQLIAGLSGTAAIGLDGITRDSLPDFHTASALVGLRYSF